MKYGASELDTDVRCLGWVDLRRFEPQACFISAFENYTRYPQINSTGFLPCTYFEYMRVT